MATANGSISRVRVNPAMGRNLGTFLLNKFAESERIDLHTSDDKWRMFAEMIMRLSTDVAGNRYALAEDRSQISSFDRIFEEIKNELDAFARVLEALPRFTKGIVQTPHPTEVLTREAIDAEGELHRLLETN